MRETYERQHDLENEAGVIELVEERWNCRARKLPRSYRLDYALERNGQIRAWAEIKCRGKRYGTYMLSLHKVLAGLELAEATGTPFLLIVRYDDATLCTTIRRNMAAGVAIGGRQDRGDWQDMEPVVHIPMKEFKRIA